VPRPFRQPRQHDYGLGPKSRKNESGLTQGPLSATSLGGPLNKKLRTHSPWRTLCAADLLFWSRPLLWANFTCGAASSCGAGFRAGLGALYPLPSLPPTRRPQWSMPPSLPHRQFWWSKPPPSPHQPLRGARSPARSASTRPSKWGVPTGLPPLQPPHLFNPRCPPRSQAAPSFCTSTPLTIQNPQKSSPSPSHPDVTRVKAASQPRIHSPLDDRPAVRK
jgi:hypothetical protein